MDSNVSEESAASFFRVEAAMYDVLSESSRTVIVVTAL
jgi:hypothetical protein